MTRQERAADRERRLKEKIEADQRALAQVQAQRRAEARAERTRRRLTVGTLVETAGLCVWDDTTLAGLFQTLSLLRETPDPVAALASLLASPACRAVGSGNGLAHPTDGVPLAGQKE